MIVFRLFPLYNLTFCSENLIFIIIIIIILHLYWSQLSLFPSAQYLCSASTLVARQPQCDAKKSRLFFFLCVSFKAFFPKRQTIPVRFSKACFKKCFHFVIQKNPIHHPPRDTEEHSVCKKRMIIWSTAKSIYSNCVRISPFTHTQRSPRHVGTQHLYCQTADLPRKRAKHKIDL